MKTRIRLLTALALTVAAAGCNVVLGLDDYQAPPDGVGCAANEQKVCVYGGPGVTKDVGLCRAGVQNCEPDGSGFGPCEGEVLPAAAEDCTTPGDDDCDGQTNEAEECSCTPGTMMPCYSGAAGTENVGVCKAGTQTCKSDGLGYDACAGEVLPSVENCATVADEDCDGKDFDDVGDGCVCEPAISAACYTGPTGTQDVGVCAAGMWTCNADGLGYGACNGETTPAPADDCKVVGDEDCNGSGCSDHRFSAAYGNLANQELNDIATDPNGNVIMVGGFYGSIKFGGDTLAEAGNGDVFVVKFAPDGSPLWAKQFGAIAFQTATAVATDAAGDIYITGFFSGTLDFGVGAPLVSGASTDGFVAKIKSDGTSMWAVKYAGTTNDELWDIAVDTKGRPVVVGDFNDGEEGIIIQRYSTTGVNEVNKLIASIVNQSALAVATDSSDNIYVGGRFLGTVNFGIHSLTAANVADAFLTKLDTFGNFAWAKKFGVDGNQTVTNLAVDSAANIVVTGTNDGTADFGSGSVTGLGAFLMKVDPAALSLGGKQLGGGASLVAHRLAVDSNNNILLAGRFNGFINLGGGPINTTGGTDMFLAKFDSGMTHLWSKGFGDSMSQTQFGYGVAAGPTGIVYLAGQGTGAVDFGGGAVVGGGATEIFFASFEP